MQAPSDGGNGVKAYRRGTHRTVTPEQTIARVLPLRDAFGITRVANLTGLDRTGIPVVMVCRPNARSSAVFHGKGVDIATAKASGLMEAIETWHAEHTRLPLRFGSSVELGADAGLVDIAGLPRAPGRDFHEHLPMLWTEGRNLVDGTELLLPFEIVHADGTVAGPAGSGCFAASTNGLASGNHLLEAASHAICEVIERDATSLWNRLPPARQDETRLDLGTVQDEACVGILERLARAQLDVAVWDITTDIGVSAFQCLAIDRTGEIRHVGRGAGCHPTRTVALLRALTEAVQVRTTYIVGSREDISHADYRHATLDVRRQRAQSLMRPVERMRDFARSDDSEFDSFESEVAWLVARLKAIGLRQVILVDLTRPEFGLPVVRVVVPGLEGSDHHAHYVPGRRAQAAREGRR